MRYHKSWPSIVFNSNRLLGRRQRDQTDEKEKAVEACSRMGSVSGESFRAGMTTLLGCEEISFW